ncbi:hypothetical protein Tco_1337475 [Tanacetum coccineum]
MSSFIPLPQQTTPTPTPTTEATTFAPALPDFSALFQFNNRVSALETEISQLKQADQSTQLLETVKSQVSVLVNDRLDTRLGDTKEKFMEVVSNSMMAKISEQVKIKLPTILPKEVYDFVTPIIKSTITESLEDKIFLEKMQKSQSYLAAPAHKELYDFKDHKDKDKDEDPFTGSDQRLKKRKTSKDTEAQKEEPVFEVADTEMPRNQGSNLGNTYEEPKDTAAPSHDWFTKPKGPPTSTDLEWNKSKTLKEGPTQSWISTISHAEEPSTTFNQLMSTPINFSAYIMNRLKIKNLTQEVLLGPAFDLLKGTCNTYAELEYDFKECYKALSEGSSTDDINTSITKTKVAKYDLQGIEDMVPNLWSRVKTQKRLGVCCVVKQKRQSYPGLQSSGPKPLIRASDYTETLKKEVGLPTWQWQHVTRKVVEEGVMFIQGFFEVGDKTVIRALVNASLGTWQFTSQRLCCLTTLSFPAFFHAVSGFLSFWASFSSFSAVEYPNPMGQDKDEDPFTGSDQRLKKRKTSKDTEAQKEEPVFEVADTEMPRNQGSNLGNTYEEPKDTAAPSHDWFTKPKGPPTSTDLEWNKSKTLKEGPTQSWISTISHAEEPSTTFNQLMSTPIDFYAYIMNRLKIKNLTQEVLLGPAFDLLKGTCNNYAELEYDFKECYKALSE